MNTTTVTVAPKGKKTAVTYTFPGGETWTTTFTRVPAFAIVADAEVTAWSPLPYAVRTSSRIDLARKTADTMRAEGFTGVHIVPVA